MLANHDGKLIMILFQQELCEGTVVSDDDDFQKPAKRPDVAMKKVYTFMIT